MYFRGREEQPFINRVCLKFEYNMKIPYTVRIKKLFKFKGPFGLMPVDLNSYKWLIKRPYPGIHFAYISYC